MLRDDEERYRAELLHLEETRESRVDIMRARMHELKSKREEERKQVVEEKLLQRWRSDLLSRGFVTKNGVVLTSWVA